MPFIIADRVKETTTSTGTGALALAGASTGYRAFSSVCANNDTVAYAISSSSGAEWETGLGTWTTGNTLARTTVIASSNGNAAVSFSAGPKDVYITVLAAQVSVPNRACDGRLTLTSGTPVTTGDVIGATSVFDTPTTGNEIALFNGTAWQIYRFTEGAIALGTLVALTNYDIFTYDVAGAVAWKIGPAWASDTARGTGAGTTELVYQDGIRVNANAIAGGPAAKCGRYRGTFRTTSTTTTEDSRGGTTTQVGGKRFLFNENNRVERDIAVIDTTDSWSYTTNTIRQANAASGNKVEYVVGDASVRVRARLDSVVFLLNNSATAAKSGIGIDSTTTFSGLVQGGYDTLGQASTANLVGGLYSAIGGDYSGQPGLGYHAIDWNEKGGDANCTFLGDNGGDGQQTGLIATLSI